MPIHGCGERYADGLCGHGLFGSPDNPGCFPDGCSGGYGQARTSDYHHRTL